MQGSKSEIVAKKLLDITNKNAEGHDFETETESEQQEENDKEGDETEIVDKRVEDLERKDYSGAKKLDVAIHELYYSQTK